MKLLPCMLAPLLLGSLAHAAQVNIIETAVNDVDGSTLSAVSVNKFVEVGTTHTTVTAPASWSSYRFTHWTCSDDPATPFRDAWGRSRNPAAFVVLAASTATAHYLPATRDTDSDGLPDWYETEYFGDLTRSASNDSDADGVSLLAEYTSGSSPIYANSLHEGGAVWTDSALVTCNLAGYPTYTLRSVPSGTVNQTAVVAPGTVVTVPDLSANTSFAYWTLDGVRQQDAWGRAVSTLGFTVAAADREAVAYLISGDSDGDRVPDAYEQRYYGSLSNNGASDTDGDGITLLVEYTSGSSPLYANSLQEGGVAWTDSALVTCNMAGYHTYTLRSVPAGTVNQSATVAPGTVVTVPDLSANAAFAYWTLDGVRQQDAWGRAVSTLSFTMEAADREAVAYLISGDSDGDGVPDAYEQRYYGSLSNDGASDTDGDGITLLVEYTSGSSPLYANSLHEGGVVWTDSSLVNADLQAEIVVEQPTGRELGDGASCAFGTAFVGNPTSLTFTIRNVGGSPLTGLGITLTGTDAAMFSVTASPTPPVSHYDTTRFTVQFAPTASGPKTAVLQITSNDADENPFDLVLAGTGTNSNAPPVASDATYTRAVSTSLKIGIAGLLSSSTSDPDGDVRTLQSVGTSTQGATITQNSSQILYSPANNNDDSFGYTISDGQGHTATATIHVSVVPQHGRVVNFTRNSNGQPMLKFAGIPGYRYAVERSPDLGDWTVIQRFNAPATGVFSFTDPTDPPLPSAFYRMRYDP